MTPGTSNPVQQMAGKASTLFMAALALLFLWPHGAAAQDRSRASVDLTGTYEVRFEEVQNSCATTGMNLRRASVELSQRTRNLQVTIPGMPVMTGRVQKGGKFKADAKRGGTAIRGVDGRFAISGRVNEGVLQFVLIAEYFQGKKPLCTQSWNGSGVHKGRL